MGHLVDGHWWSGNWVSSADELSLFLVAAAPTGICCVSDWLGDARDMVLDVPRLAV